MARIVGVNIPDNKRIEVSLTYIYGIGRVLSGKILKLANISPDLRTNTITTEQLEKIKSIIEKNYKIEGNLRTVVNQNIKRLKEINTYRGIRHNKKLPVRGQRTKTNARTKRGKRVTVGSGKKPSAQKT